MSLTPLFYTPGNSWVTVRSKNTFFKWEEISSKSALESVKLSVLAKSRCAKRIMVETAEVRKKEVERGVRVENGDGAADTQHINTS